MPLLGSLLNIPWHCYPGKEKVESVQGSQNQMECSPGGGEVRGRTVQEVGGQNSGSKPIEHTLLYHQILLIRYKFIHKITTSFKMATTEHEIPSAGSFWVWACVCPRDRPCLAPTWPAGLLLGEGSPMRQCHGHKAPGCPALPLPNRTGISSLQTGISLRLLVRY